VKASEYKAWICAELDKVIEEHGDIPVVAWQQSTHRLSEHMAHQYVVELSEYKTETAAHKPYANDVRETAIVMILAD
jgi:hypothetical protein